MHMFLIMLVYMLQTPVSPVLSPGAQPTVGAGSVYGVTQLPSTHTLAGPYASLPSSAGPSSSNQKEQVFPERPGQQECQYYLRTGDCKFGSSCRYHHPREWVVPKTNCVLSPLGLPLRPVCLFTHFVTLFYNLGSILIFLSPKLLKKYKYAPAVFFFSFSFLDTKLYNMVFSIEDRLLYVETSFILYLSNHFNVLLKLLRFDVFKLPFF